ncbi:MAG: Ig-like domain-containing protein [Lachnospiraceae bacterium]|nr:Ig-like domain-containing protein [Lachnospiraceae bacterium]
MTGTLNSINIPIEGVTAQPGSYNADITVSVNSTDYSAYNFYVLYSDTEANLPVDDVISDIYIYSDKWNYAGEQDNEKDYEESKQTIYFKPQGFHPSATYYYQLFYEENGAFYKITNAASFTTKAAVTESKVSFTDFTVKEIGYTKAKVEFQLVNPDDENIVNQNIYIKGGINPSYASEMYDEDGNIIPDMYEGTVFLGKDQSKDFWLEAEVYTGDLVKTPVTTAPVTITAKSSADLQTTCTPKSFVNSAVMSIKLNPYYRVDSYQMNLNFEYKPKGSESTSSNNANATASENSILLTDLTANTEYEYTLKIYDDYSNTNLLTSCTGSFQTTQDTEYLKSDFDEQIFNKIIGQLNLSTDITTIKQSQLEKITELKITSEDVVTSVLPTPVLSLNGVNHLVNLTDLEITGQDLSSAFEIENLTSLESINLAGNKLTEMPNLSKLNKISSAWNFNFKYNFIESSSITEAKLPASISDKTSWITETRSNQLESTTQCITADKYYAIGVKHPFFLEAQNFPIKRKYTLTVTVNEKEKTSTIEASNGAYYYSFPDLEIAAGTYQVAMKLTDCYGNKQWEETRTITFAGDEGVIEDVYADASDKELSVIGYIPGTFKATEIQLKNAEGIVVGKDSYTNSYSSNYRDSRYDGIFSKIYEFNENDIKWNKMQISSTIQFSKLLTEGDYHLVIKMEDEKEYSFTNIVHISAKAVIAEINRGYRENQKNDNAGAYYYLDMRGVNIDPQKVWPVIKAKDGKEISEKSSVAYIGNSTYQYQLKKLEVDTYWKDQSTLHVTVGSESGYEFVDGRKNKTITYYEQSDHVRSEYYNYRSSVNKYRVCFDSKVTDGTKVSIKLYSDSNYRTQLAVAEGTVTKGWANLNLKGLDGNEFVPDRDKYYYKKIVYTENYKGTENYSSKITWYGIDSNSSSSMSYRLNSDDAIRTSDSTSIDFDITLPNQTDKTLTYEAYLDKTSNSKLGDAVSLRAEETTYNGKKCVKLTGKRGTGTQLSSGKYYLNVYCNNTLVATPRIAVYNNDLFYMESNYAYGNSNGDYKVYIESNQLKGEYRKVYHSKVSDADALQLVKDSYTLEVHDLLGNEINGWSVKSASYSDAYIWITLTGIPADYLGCYIKVLSKTNKEGYTLDGTDSTVYYENETYNVDPKYGYYATDSTASLRFQTSTERHDEKTSWSSYDSIEIGERSGMLPVTVNFYKIGDNTPTKTLKIKKAGEHQFTSSELSGISSTEVYFMTAESEDRKQGENETGYVGVITSSVDVPEADITLSLDQTSISMQEGNTVKLTATPSAITEEKLSWSSSNQKVANVDNGTVTAIGAGTAIITASLSGGASAKCQIIVTGKSALDAVDIGGATVKAIKKQIYTGQMVTPKLTVKNGKDTLVENADYILSYRNNSNAGIDTAVAIIYGIGAYNGTKEIKFTIAPKAIKGVSMEAYDMVTTGMALSPAVIIMDNGKRLTEGVDFSITGLKNNQKAGTGKFTIEGINNYTGKKSGSFKIFPVNTKILTGLSITADIPESGYTYDGKKKMPVLTVKDSSGGVLQIKKDYTVSYKSNVNAGTAIAIVKGKGSNKGTKNYYFKIKALDVSTETTREDIKAVNYTGTAVNPKVIVKNKAGKKLKINKDYTLTYSNNYQASTTTKAGTATVVITGKGNYSGTVTKDFLINKIALGKGFAVKELKTQTYTGEALTPSFKLYYKKRLLKQDQDYTVTYNSNVKVGKGEIIINAVEGSSFTGSMTKIFKIK